MILPTAALLADMRRPTSGERRAFRHLADAARRRRLQHLDGHKADDNPPRTGHLEHDMADNKPTRPKLHAYFVKPPKADGDKGIWIKVGAAFENRDGSLSLNLDSIPPPEGPNGWRLQLREPYDDEGADAGDRAPARTDRAPPARGRR